jgi:hypothetical protein
MNRWDENDTLIHLEGDMQNLELDESAVAIRKLSVRATAQVDRDNGDLELCDENGIHVFDAEEALELLELLYQERDTLYALAHQGER